MVIETCALHIMLASSSLEESRNCTVFHCDQDISRPVVNVVPTVLWIKDVCEPTPPSSGRTEAEQLSCTEQFVLTPVDITSRSELRFRTSSQLSTTIILKWIITIYFHDSVNAIFKCKKTPNKTKNIFSPF